MLPDGPPRSTETTLRWLTRPYDLLRECAERYGDRFTLDLGGDGPFVIVSTPAAVHDVFTADPSVLHAGEANGVMGAFLGPRSLLLLEERRHHEERRLLAPAFHGRRVASFARTIEDAALDELDTWSAGDELVAQHAMQRISIAVILRAVFGVEAGPARAELGDSLLRFLEDPKFNLALMGSLDARDMRGSPAWLRWVASLDRIRALLRGLVTQRRASGDADGADVLSMMLAARREDGSGLTDAELEDELLTLCVTGYETTATALAWGLYWLHRSPAALAELAARWTRRPLEAAVRDAWIESLCKEVLRVHPVIPVVARRVRRSIPIDGEVVPEGAVVAPCIYLVHHRPELYPDPCVFRAERFVARRYGPYEYLPFGGGARRCIGMQLACFEMRIVLGTVVANARLSLLDPGEVRPRRRSVTIAPDAGPRFRVLGTGEAHARTG